MKDEYRLMYTARAKQRSFTRLVESSKTLIQEYLNSDVSPYFSFSGGKDSVACAILLHEIGATTIPVFSQSDDFDFPDLEEYRRRVISALGFSEYYYMESDISAISQIKNFSDIEQIQGTFSHVIKRLLQQNPHLNGNIMGLRAEEAHGRRKLIQVNGAVYTRKKMGRAELVCLPVAKWRGSDIFALIIDRGLEYYHIYDKDDLHMPHEIRLSWPIAPQFFSYGVVSEFRQNYPELYARYIEFNKNLSRYT